MTYFCRHNFCEYQSKYNILWYPNLHTKSGLITPFISLVRAGGVPLTLERFQPPNDKRDSQPGFWIRQNIPNLIQIVAISFEPCKKFLIDLLNLI
ncbi:hypothetical protein D0A37_14240 [Microcoleus vaginatus HSN003]|nr:hypothetical protein D0A37_14240 [Microcoleus vaginatus HSN003]